MFVSTFFGGYASQVVVPAIDVFALPDELSFEQGAAIPVNYATAWASLMDYGDLQPGGRVLIHSAGGGVGIAATQIAKREGAEVYGTASPGKHARIAELGVDHALDYTKSGWERGLPKFDVIMDAVGGASFRRSYDLLRPGGRLVAFGASAVVSGQRRNPVTALRTVAADAALQHDQADVRIEGRCRPEHAHPDGRTAGRSSHGSAPLQALLDDGTVRPVVAESFSFERCGRGAEHDHRTAQRRQGRIDSLS